MSWRIKSTETFKKNLKKQKSNHELLAELDKKIKRLKSDPIKIGGMLSGKLYGKKSTRLTHKYRLLFSIDSKKHAVYLVALDHRKIYTDIHCCCLYS